VVRTHRHVCPDRPAASTAVTAALPQVLAPLHSTKENTMLRVETGLKLGSLPKPAEPACSGGGEVSSGRDFSSQQKCLGGCGEQCTVGCEAASVPTLRGWHGYGGWMGLGASGESQPGAWRWGAYEMVSGSQVSDCRRQSLSLDRSGLTRLQRGALGSVWKNSHVLCKEPLV